MCVPDISVGRVHARAQVRGAVSRHDEACATDPQRGLPQGQSAGIHPPLGHVPYQARESLPLRLPSEDTRQCQTQHHWLDTLRPRPAQQEVLGVTVPAVMFNEIYIRSIDYSIEIIQYII